MIKLKRKIKAYQECCFDCGKQIYNKKNELIGISVCMGTCPICKKNKFIVPSRDWMYYEGDDSMWD